MIKIIKKDIVFFLAILIIWLSVGVILLFGDKASVHLYLNGKHTAALDLLFSYLTNLGDGLVPVCLVVLFLFFALRKALIIGASGLLGGLLAQFFKRVVFSDIVRPKAFFQDIAELYFVPGVEVHSYFSFPSGHTTTAFSMAICLIYFTKNPFLKTLYLILAILTGYSRVYLSQHFLVDVYFGSVLGVLISLFCIKLFISIKNDKLDGSVLKLL